MSSSAHFDESSNSVRFWIMVAGLPVGAIINSEALERRYPMRRAECDPLQTYLDNAEKIDAAVRRRVASGAIEPVRLSEQDLL